MNALAETDQTRDNPAAPLVVGSYNVVGSHNTVVFPGVPGDWNETHVQILRALPHLSDAELARVELLVQQSVESGGLER